MDHFYRQPKYFSKFRCVGGECPESCCDGWNVDWKKEEIDKLKSTDCSERLGKLVDSSFEIQPTGYYGIKMEPILCTNSAGDPSGIFSERAVCPFHNQETGLCDIQFELGEKFLGTVCTQYPRHYIETGNQILRWCATSCPAVIDLLLDNEEAAETENVIARDHKKLDRSTVTVDNAEAVRSDPIRRLRNELFNFYTRMLFDKSRSFDTSIILTALAVKHFTDAETSRNFNRIPKIADDLVLSLNDPVTVKSADEIRPNYQLKFKLVNNMLVKFFGNKSHIVNIFSLHDGNELVVERYLTGLEKFGAEFGNKDYILKNVIMNTFYDMNLPLGKLKRPLFENYAYFVLAAASIKTVAAAIGYAGGNIRENFKKGVAEMSRSYSHNIKMADDIAEEIKQMGLTSPAHMAIIIKG